MARISTLLQIIKKHWGVIVLSVLFLLIFVANFPFGKWLIGWDSLTPEMNFWLNLRYALFAGWQPHYGSGALIGHGYAATLPHVLLTGLLNLFLPLQAIRPTFIFGCWYLGGVGMYFFIKKLLEKFQGKGDKKLPTIVTTLLQISTALFYSFNFGTTQIFYHPLEAFTVQFALLPWTFLILESYFSTGKKINLVFLFFISFIGSVQGFIPSSFLAYAISVCLFVFIKAIRRNFTLYFFRAIVCLVIIFLSNSYWLGTFSYYTLEKSDIFLNAYQNQIQTPQFLARTEKYGTLSSVITLKSLFLEGKLFNQNVFEPWLTFLEKYNYPVVISYVIIFIFAISSIAITTIHRKYRIFFPYVVLFLFFFSSLATQTPFFKEFNHILYEISPLYEQAFRTAFTKVGLGYVFTLSTLYTVTIVWLLIIIHNKLIQKFLSFVILIIVIGLIFPHFQGNSFYKQLKVSMPTAYEKIIHYFQNEPNEGYVVEMPLGCNDGWYSYNWGYTGSGFYWYAVEQSFLARPFDVWNQYNESFFWQTERAIRDNDLEMLDAIFSKYHARWILVDPNISHCRNEKSNEYVNQLESFFTTNPNYEKAFTTNEGVQEAVTIYKRKIETPVTVSTLNNIEVVTDKDRVFEPGSAYIEINPTNINDSFSLFSQKRNNKDSFTFFTSGEKKYVTFASDQTSSITLPYENFLLGDVLYPKPCKSSDSNNVYEASYSEIGDLISTTMYTKNGSDCASFSLYSREFSQGGFISFSALNKKGQPLKLIISDDLGQQYLEVIVTNFQNTYFIPPASPKSELLTIEFISQSFSPKESINELQNVSIGALIDTTAGQQLKPEKIELDLIPIKFLNKNSIFHSISGNTLAVLPNSFDSDWYLFTKTNNSSWWKVNSYSRAEHFRYNSWANAWITPPDTTEAIVFYVPQFINFGGYGVLLICFIFLFLLKLKHMRMKRK